MHLLKRSPSLDESAAELVDLAEREVRRLSNISRQTLAPHRETKTARRHPDFELLDDVFAMYRPRLQAAKIDVERDYRITGEVTSSPMSYARSSPTCLLMPSTPLDSVAAYRWASNRPPRMRSW